tara:strand:+ start:623 stop:826 length:204 start_codon:yes stop_codon:yes gene_type:complete
MTRQQTQEQDELETILDELQSEEVAIQINRVNRTRKHRQQSTRGDEENEGSSFERWVETRKRKGNRR